MKGTTELLLRSSMLESTGTIDSVYDNERFKTYYRFVGKFGHRPLLMLHGGLGVPTKYIFCIDDLASDGTPVIYYNQIG